MLQDHGSGLRVGTVPTWVLGAGGIGTRGGCSQPGWSERVPSSKGAVGFGLATPLGSALLVEKGKSRGHLRFHHGEWLQRCPQVSWVLFG